MVCKYFLPFGRLPFHFVDGLHCSKFFYVDFCFVAFALMSNSKSLARSIEDLTPLRLSFRWFIVWVLFKSLFHLELCVFMWYKIGV